MFFLFFLPLSLLNLCSNTGSGRYHCLCGSGSSDQLQCTLWRDGMKWHAKKAGSWLRPSRKFMELTSFSSLFFQKFIYTIYFPHFPICLHTFLYVCFSWLVKLGWDMASLAMGLRWVKQRLWQFMVVAPWLEVDDELLEASCFVGILPISQGVLFLLIPFISSSPPKKIVTNHDKSRSKAFWPQPHVGGLRASRTSWFTLSEAWQSFFNDTTVDGSEIRRSPVEVGSVSHYFTRFFYIPGWCRMFFKQHYGNYIGGSRVPFRDKNEWGRSFFHSCKYQINWWGGVKLKSLIILLM